MMMKKKRSRNRRRRMRRRSPCSSQFFNNPRRSLMWSLEWLVGEAAWSAFSPHHSSSQWQDTGKDGPTRAGAASHTSRCIPESSPAADRPTDRQGYLLKSAVCCTSFQERTTHCCYLGSGFFFFFFFYREAQLVLDSERKQEDLPAQSNMCSSFHIFHLYSHSEWLLDVTKCYYFNLLLLFVLHYICQTDLGSPQITSVHTLYVNVLSNEGTLSFPLMNWRTMFLYAHKQMITMKHWLDVFQFPCYSISQVLH